MSKTSEVKSDSKQPRWKFGYGSNMSPEFLKRKKNLTAIRCEPCILRDWALVFPFGMGMDWVEPSFAAISRDPGSDVHGTATLLSDADCASLDNQEKGYDIVTCEVQFYDGTIVNAECYAKRNQVPVSELKQGSPSARYLSILIAGAKEAKLDEGYIKRLQAIQTYSPPAHILEKRAALCDNVDPASLPQITLAELKQRDGSDGRPPCTGSLGYVIEAKAWASFAGRDITRRNVIHFRGLSVDTHDDGGVSPFPVVAEMVPVELEYVKQWRDWLLSRPNARVVGALKEFWDDQPAQRCSKSSEQKT